MKHDDYISAFETRFGHINYDSLSTAAMEDPQFLAGFIKLRDIRPLTRAIALSKLGLSLNESFMDFLKSYTTNESSLVREGAFQGLAEYFFFDEEKHADLLEFFESALELEPGEGVRRQIGNLIGAIQLYQE